MDTSRIFLLLMLVGLLSLGCTFPYTSAPSPDVSVPSPSTLPSPASAPPTLPNATDTPPSNPTPTSVSETYTGQRLAGSTTPYIRYNEADYGKALQEGKAIYLYFRANWCPICNRDRPDILATFNELQNPNAVGFEVHYNDDETTDADRSLARQFGITYQHTTLIVQGDVILYRSLSTVSKDELKARLS